MPIHLRNPAFVMLLQERERDHKEQTCAGEENPEPVFSTTLLQGKEVNLHIARLKALLFVSHVLFTLQSECLVFVYISFCYPLLFTSVVSYSYLPSHMCLRSIR